MAELVEGYQLKNTCTSATFTTMSGDAMGSSRQDGEGNLGLIEHVLFHYDFRPYANTY
jgi:hypothetical protein